MRGTRYPATAEGLLEWVADCRALVRSDDDNLILFSGDTGAGKSTALLQIMRLLDPEGFGVERIHFKIKEFMEAADNTPKYGSLVCDEFLASRRKAMWTDIVELNDFFQWCRYLNLQMAICFPQMHRMDTPISEDRVKWRVHVKKTMRLKGGKRGRGFILSERVVKEYQIKGKEVREVYWIERGRWGFAANVGPLWDAYLAKKRAHMRTRGVNVAAQPGEVAATELELGFDFAALRDAFAQVLAKQGEAAAQDAEA